MRNMEYSELSPVNRLGFHHLSDAWFMKFNPTKCKMNIGHIEMRPSYVCHLAGRIYQPQICPHKKKRTRGDVITTFKFLNEFDIVSMGQFLERGKKYRV